MGIETLLNEEIQAEFNALKDIEMGSDKYKTTVDSLTKLCDRAIEMRKHEVEMDIKSEQYNADYVLKEQQAKDEKRDRIVKNCLTGAGIIIPTVATIWGTLKSIKFEETGTITTIMGRGFIQKLLPKK